ncbi:MAG: hypothetical protein ACXVA9_05300 [Bdellovibrionales bacterium]
MKPMHKIAAAILGLTLTFSVTKSFAADNSTQLFDKSCAVDTERQAQVDGLDQDHSSAIVSCAGGRSFEIKQITPNGGKCSSSFWCGAFEHCVDGKCVPKDMFHGCDMFHTCSFGDKCVNRVCKH